MDETIKNYIDEELKKHEILYVSYDIDGDQLTSAIIAVAETARVIITTMSESLRDIAKWFDGYDFSLDPFEIIEGKKQAHRLDFTRPTIKHQVLDRKPRQLIKKIIH